MKKRREIEKIIGEIVQDWFLSEPVLFAIFCTHELVEKNEILVPFRTGKRRIEFNSELLSEMKADEIAEYLKIEIYRILLRHPYQRQPLGAKKPYLAIASDAVIYANYVTDIKLGGVELIKEMLMRFTFMVDGLPRYRKKLTTENDSDYRIRPLKATDLTDEEFYKKELPDGTKIDFVLEKTTGEMFVTTASGGNLIVRSAIRMFCDRNIRYDETGRFLLPKELCFEEWDSKIMTLAGFTDEDCSEKIEDGNRDGQDKKEKREELFRHQMDKLSQQSELWENDDETRQKIDNIIEEAEKSSQWGGISGNLRDMILANKRVLMNYSEILRHFCTSVISSRRILTRMKPSRRFGFEHLGSRFRLASNLLIAVDLSGSITRENLSYFFSIINQFFRYGLEKIDVIQFDEKVLSDEPLSMNKALECFHISGRGGTDFQPVADFYSEHSEYDGLIYFTDGLGFKPDFARKNAKVLWIINTSDNYKKALKWISKLPGNSATFIPLP